VQHLGLDAWQEVFDKVLAALPATVKPDEVVLFEDSFKNLEMARSLGMRTVLIGESSRVISWYDRSERGKRGLACFAPTLWVARGTPAVSHSARSVVGGRVRNCGRRGAECRGEFGRSSRKTRSAMMRRRRIMMRNHSQCPG
jgi:hypothetical protein